MRCSISDRGRHIMVRRHIAWLLVLPGLALGLASFALAQGQPAGGGAGPAAKKSPAIRTKVYRLTQCDPVEVRDILEQLLDSNELTGTQVVDGGPMVLPPGFPGG